jgi:hypothetical protein
MAPWGIPVATRRATRRLPMDRATPAAAETEIESPRATADNTSRWAAAARRWFPRVTSASRAAVFAGGLVVLLVGVGRPSPRASARRSAAGRRDRDDRSRDRRRRGAEARGLWLARALRRARAGGDRAGRGSLSPCGDVDSRSDDRIGGDPSPAASRDGSHRRPGL